MGKIDVCHLSQDKHRSLMNQKIRIKNIIVSSSIIIAIGLLVVFDHQVAFQFVRVETVDKIADFSVDGFAVAHKLHIMRYTYGSLL